MVTCAEHRSNFITDGDPSVGMIVEVLCEDHVDSYLLPFLYRSTQHT